VVMLRDLAAVLGVTATLVLHPLHTTLTQLEYRAADETVRVTVRAFADDFTAAAGGAVDSVAARYLRAVVTLTGRDDRRLPLAWCGLRQTGDLLWLCLQAPAPGGLAGIRIEARQLFERYSDQINIVQANYEGRDVSLLFVRGDRARRLP
jgi:uncharacterized protein DUF6702